MNNVVIVGAGPAGIAAALAASHSKAQVTVLDDNSAVGGQIWRGGDRSNHWIASLSRSDAKVVTGARVVSGDAISQTLLVDKDGQTEQISYTKLILATGARELFLPFPGWTLPNVMGVGGLQALVKSGFPVAGKRIIVAGSGPLLLAVASYLRKHGAIVPLIAEQASLGSLARFTLGLASHPAKLIQAVGLYPRHYLTGCWIEAALGSKHVNRVRLRRQWRVWEEPCDFVANAYGFVPNTELATLLGCVLEAQSARRAAKHSQEFARSRHASFCASSLEDGFVQVDSSQQTSVPNIYCAGETAGIGGVDTALVEGQIAGFAATGQSAAALKLYPARHKAKSFARRLNQTFHPRPELRALAQPGTIVCRCEDVPLARLQTAGGWRSAKLHERCGMGPCQGRICGPAVQFILGWDPSSVRPPIFPTRLENLLQENSVK